MSVVVVPLSGAASTRTTEQSDGESSSPVPSREGFDPLITRLDRFWARTVQMLLELRKKGRNPLERPLELPLCIYSQAPDTK